MNQFSSTNEVAHDPLATDRGAPDTSPQAPMGAAATTSNATPQPLTHALEVADRLRARLKAAVYGRDEVIDLVLTALLADGHILLEDYPGSGKTTLAKALGLSITASHAPSTHDVRIESFRRIQFTPDLLPSDITGTAVFDLERQDFSFRSGPIFSHIVLADEINRTSPKVQAAMLEAMAEKQVTVDNQTHALDELFFVIATQNPLDLAGTYPLPTPQLDRFLFKVRMKHIPMECELDILHQYPTTSLARAEPLPTVGREDILHARHAIRDRVHVHEAIRKAVVAFAGNTRKDPRILQGTSTRSLLLLLPALQVRALLHGRDHVLPEDLEALAPFVFVHRMEFAPGIADPVAVVKESLLAPLEELAKHSIAAGKGAPLPPAQARTL